MFESFTYEEYEMLLGMLRDGRENLTFSDMRAISTPQRYFILRHDVDFCPKAALKMARFEAQRGIRATYFLLLSSEFYNLLSEESCTIPRELVALGHEVGLHYDVRAMYARCGEIIDMQLQWEIDILSRLAGKAVCSVAMHNPSTLGKDPFAGNDQYVNAYAPRYTKDIAYYSDSCGAWRDQTHHALVHSRIPETLQILIHPFFWEDTPGNRWERLDSWVGERRRLLMERQQGVHEMWREHAGVIEHERRMGNG